MILFGKENDNLMRKSFSKKFQPNHMLYIGLLILCLAVRISPFSIGMMYFDEVLNELSVGVLGSVLATYFLDMAACKRRNQEYKEKMDQIFSEYMNSMYFLRNSVANKCMKCCGNSSEKKSFEEWTLKLADKLDESDGTNTENVLICSSIRRYVGNVRENLYVLKIQYISLVHGGYIETGDFSQHLNLQINICDEILYSSKLFEKGDFIFDEFLIELEKNWRSYFAEKNIEEKFNPQNGRG